MNITELKKKIDGEIGLEVHALNSMSMASLRERIFKHVDELTDQRLLETSTHGHEQRLYEAHTLNFPHLRTDTLDQLRRATEILDVIDRFLAHPATPREEKTKLWNILTALRGPDSGDERLKIRTTTVVRSIALPLVAKYPQEFPNACFSDRVDYEDWENIYVANLKLEGGIHFTDHIEQAVYALAEARKDVVRQLPRRRR